MKALVTKDYILPLHDNADCEGVMPLGLAVQNSDKPVWVIGVPGKVKKAVMKLTKNVFDSRGKSKLPKVKALVQTPVTGGIIDLSDSKQDVNYWFENGSYVMTIEEAEMWLEHFAGGYCISSDEEQGWLNKVRGVKPLVLEESNVL